MVYKTSEIHRRSWAIEDDAEIIQEYLDEVVHMIKEANPREVVAAFTVFETPGQNIPFEIVETLVLYYQMESRSQIRFKLLHLFTTLGMMHAPTLPVLQTSVLPLELARALNDDMELNASFVSCKRQLFCSFLPSFAFFCVGSNFPSRC